MSAAKRKLAEVSSILGYNPQHINDTYPNYISVENTRGCEFSCISNINNNI